MFSVLYYGPHDKSSSHPLLIFSFFSDIFSHLTNVAIQKTADNYDERTGELYYQWIL